MSERSLASAAAEADLRLAEAESLKYDNHLKMLDAAQAAAAHAQTLGDFRRFALALAQQAWAYANLSRYEPSLTHALEALSLARSHGFGDIEGRAVNTIALCFSQCGIGQEAIRLYDYQLELGQRLQDGEVQSTALHDLALLRLGEGDTAAALDLLYRALVLMPPNAHDGLDHSVMHGNLSLACLNAGRLDDALPHAQQALALAREAESTPLVGHAHVIMASVYHATGDLDSAYEQLEEARACIEPDVPSALAANIEYVVAQLLTRAERHQDAVLAWERAYDLAVQGQFLESAIDVLHKLKEAYEQVGDMTGVVSAYQRLTQDIPRFQKQGSDLRFSVLRMVFAMDKAAVQSDIELTQQKNAILQRLSHEFRTPLTVIQSTAELVERYGERLSLEQRQERLQRITGQVKWMTVMLEDIVELLKLDDSGSLGMAPVAFDLDELAQAALAGVERYRMPTASVHVEAQPGVGSLSGPMPMLATVLTHLLTNAIKFSQHEVTLALTFDGRVLTMRVADQGIGIPAADQTEVFKPLARGSNSGEVTGTGIGLSIVAKLVAHMRGTVDLVSAEGKGTTVTVKVPL